MTFSHLTFSCKIRDERIKILTLFQTIKGQSLSVVVYTMASIRGVCKVKAVLKNILKTFSRSDIGGV